MDDAVSVWPDLPYSSWRETAATLQLWTQIVGKLRLTLTPGSITAGRSHFTQPHAGSAHHRSRSATKSSRSSSTSSATASWRAPAGATQRSFHEPRAG
jgi:hypothetical protein